MVSVRLDKEVQKQLNIFANTQNISKSQVIKDSLNYYFDMLKKQQQTLTPYELGREFFGKYASGEKNLSTTYKKRLKDKISAKNSHR